jgi:hypothetical protein
MKKRLILPFALGLTLATTIAAAFPPSDPVVFTFKNKTVKTLTLEFVQPDSAPSAAVAPEPRWVYPGQTLTFKSSELSGPYQVHTCWSDPLKDRDQLGLDKDCSNHSEYPVVTCPGDPFNPIKMIVIGGGGFYSHVGPWQPVYVSCITPTPPPPVPTAR